MENERNDKVLLKLLELEQDNPKCAFALARNSLGINSIPIKTIAQKVEMPEGEVLSAMRQLEKKGYLMFINTTEEITDAYLVLSDKAKAYVFDREKEKKAQAQKQEELETLKTMAVSIAEQLKLAECEAVKATEARKASELSEKKTRRLTMIGLGIALLSILINVLIAVCTACGGK